MNLKNLQNKRWFKIATNTYVLILLVFVIWMLFFDTNSFLIHKELDDDIEALEENKEYYQSEIEKDKRFMEKMKDSDQIERFAREKYYLKKEGEDIYIIEHADSVKKDNENE